MESYQMRLREGRSLEDVADELSGAVWMTLSRHREFSHLGTMEFQALEKVVREVLVDYVRGYDVCGAQAICDEGVELSPWTPVAETEAMETDPVWEQHVRRLQVEVGTSLEEILNDLEAEVFKLLFKSPQERAWLARPMKPELDGAIKKAVGPYLYKNLACGQCDLCAQRQATDPWSKI